MTSIGDLPVLEPLSFSFGAGEAVNSGGAQLPITILCPLCSIELDLSGDKTDDFSSHLLSQHGLIIANIDEIADLPKYIGYWRKRFTEGLLIHELCKPQSDTETSMKCHYLLDDSLDEDKKLRSQLYMEKLQERLDQQQKEREDDSFSRSCLFCTRHFHFNRSALFKHMSDYHHFTISHPDNLVFTDELLTVLEQRLHNLRCLFCEKTFKDSTVLKEHMRKKRHKRLRMGNPAYRRYFLVQPELTKAEDDEDPSSDENATSSDVPDDEEFDDDINSDCADAADGDIGDTDDDTNSSVEHSDWNEWVGTPGPDCVCLFCKHTCEDTSGVFNHMKDEHGFDFHQLISAEKVTFYQQIKFINYVRRQVHCNTCISCAEKFDSPEALLMHFSSSGHLTRLPAKSLWNQPQYFFPTYENDTLLCSLVDADNGEDVDGSGDGTEEVIPEDLPEASDAGHLMGQFT